MSGFAGKASVVWSSPRASLAVERPVVVGELQLEAAGGKTVPEFVAPFLPEAEAKRVRAGGLKVKFTDYDWSLNGK